ncbi:hypothetical protein L6R29_25940, partial [Myxococcota bacterium]|nr:hypothetical protein [Myxococcota bacterium]
AASAFRAYSVRHEKTKSPMLPTFAPSPVHGGGRGGGLSSASPNAYGVPPHTPQGVAAPLTPCGRKEQPFLHQRLCRLNLREHGVFTTASLHSTSRIRPAFLWGLHRPAV